MNENTEGVTLLVIDSQNDFMGRTDGEPLTHGKNVAALPVKGAIRDMERLAGYITRERAKIGRIIVTLDTHEVVGTDMPDIGHPEFWVDDDVKHPAPFTLITREDVAKGRWTPDNLHADVSGYFEKVGNQMVWPRHCIDGTWGHQVFQLLAASLRAWELAKHKQVVYVRKGMNPLTEQYGVFEAAVPAPADPATQFNKKLLKLLVDSPKVLVAGEALDYCVKTSLEQAASRLSPEQIKKFALLTDCMSPVNVDGKNTVGLAFLADMQKRGMKVAHT